MKKEEAMEILKDFHDKSALFSVRTALETLHPELKESEDERIRKAIIEYLRQRLDRSPSIPAAIGSWIAWLEKQGDSPIKWNKNTEGNKPQINHSVLMKTTHGIAEGEWKGEYWEQYKWAGIIRDSDVLSWMELSDLEKQCEQEPVWSEDDEEQVSIITNIVKAHCGKYIDCRSNLSWLKSLKQRIGG